LSRLQRVRVNLRRAYETGRESVRTARSARNDGHHHDVDHEYTPPSPDPSVVHQSTSSRDDAEVPHSLRLAAAWSWRLIVVGLVGYVLLRFIAIISIVVIPLAIALLLSALLAPAVGWLLRARLPRSLATFLVLVCGGGAVVGTLTLVVSQFVDGLPQLTDKASAGIEQLQKWAKTGPLHLSDKQVSSAIDSAQEWINGNTSSLTATGFATAATLAEVATGAVLVLFATFFFLRSYPTPARRPGRRWAPTSGRPCWWPSSTRSASGWRW
jgi:predicted PurR-regulated permease PerM